MTRLGRVSRRVQEGSIYVLLFLLPFSKAAIEIAFGVWLGGWVIERALERGQTTRTFWAQPSTRWIAWGLAVFWLLCGASIAMSAWPLQSLKAWLCKWTEYLLMFVMAAELASRSRVAKRSLVVLGVSALLVAVEGFSQELWGRGLLRGYRLYVFNRMTGPYENPIDLGTYLMVILPPVVLAGLQWRGWRRYLWWALLAAPGVCLIRTEAFGAWLGLASGMLAITLLSPEVRAAGMAFLGLGMVAGAGFLASQGHLRDMLSLSSDIGKIDRWWMWQAALGMIRDRPVLGHGLNTFMGHYLEYWVGGERQPRYAHNCYLQMAAEAGLLGAAAFLFLLASIVRCVATRLQALTPQERLIGLGYLAGLVAFVVQAAIDTNFYALRQSALFWTMAGLAVGFVHASPDPRTF